MMEEAIPQCKMMQRGKVNGLRPNQAKSMRFAATSARAIRDTDAVSQLSGGR
jgi:hypothetical protein